MVVILGFILGLVLGSFAKAIADRSLTNRSFWGRSYCLKCKKTLAWYDLLPVFSYILLKGKCRSCHKKIPIEYFLIEVVMGVLVGFLFWQTFNNLQFLSFNLQFSFQLSTVLLDLILKIFFITILAILFITDIKDMFIPDRVIIPAIKIALLYIIVETVYKIGYLYYYLTRTELGKILLSRSDYFQRHAFYTAEPALYAILTGLGIGAFFFSLIILTRGKGMGGGDVKLGALMGVVLGFPNAAVAVVLSFLTGAIFALALILVGKKRFGEHIAFGPFLVLGSLMVMFWGDKLINWYLRLAK